MSSELNKENRPILNENDISGASLGGRHPSSLKILELKQWFVYRNASTKSFNIMCCWLQHLSCVVIPFVQRTKYFEP